MPVMLCGVRLRSGPLSSPSEFASVFVLRRDASARR
jgi:hypothetical protein